MWLFFAPTRSREWAGSDSIGENCCFALCPGTVLTCSTVCLGVIRLWHWCWPCTKQRNGALISPSLSWQRIKNLRTVVQGPQLQIVFAGISFGLPAIRLLPLFLCHCWQCLPQLIYITAFSALFLFWWGVGVGGSFLSQKGVDSLC